MEGKAQISCMFSYPHTCVVSPMINITHICILNGLIKIVAKIKFLNLNISFFLPTNPPFSHTENCHETFTFQMGI